MTFRLHQSWIVIDLSIIRIEYLGKLTQQFNIEQWQYEMMMRYIPDTELAPLIR